MKKILHDIGPVFLALIIFFYLPSCKKYEDIKASDIKPEKNLTDKELVYPYDRVKIIHLYKDTVYTLSESITRNDGEQLIIDEGTIIKASVGGFPISITINAGGVIIANGTATNPIVFTSNSDAGNQSNNWGGLMIQGRSYDNSKGAGGNPTDFSGTLNYVRIEFAPLILSAVGNATVVQNIMVSYVSNQGQFKSTSAFEIDGGNFNARNLISYACNGPSDFYITRGYSGKMQNVLAYRHPFFGGTGNNTPLNALAGIFIENNPDNSQATPNTNPAISNLTVIGPNGQDGSPTAYTDTTVRTAALVTTGNAFFRISNSLLLGYPLAAWYLDDSLTAHNLQYNQSGLTFSVVHCSDTNRVFYLKPNIYFGFSSDDFKKFMLGPQFGNELYSDVIEFKLTDPFNYNNPNPLPLDNSPVLTGANFGGADPFFEQVTYRGAFGKNNWYQGWANFTPLKTSYNFEH